MKTGDWSDWVLRDLIWRTMRDHSEVPACGFVDGEMLSYGELKVKIEQLSFWMVQQGYKKGDRVALLGNNSPNWVITYFSLLSTGVVALPILPDFHEDEILHILDHGKARSIFIAGKQYDRFKQNAFAKLDHVFRLDDFATLDLQSVDSGNEEWISYQPHGSFDPFEIPITQDDLASLIYTSGTTGFSKGVMLTNGNLVENVRQCHSLEQVGLGHSMLSILPLSHTLENTVGCLLPYSYGASVYYLEKPPTAAVLVPALKKVRPTHILSVPLVIEKIFKTQVLGKVNRSRVLKALYGFPPFRRLFHRLAGKKLMETFGGRLVFFGIGGARLEQATEKFLIEAKFPYAIGYGLTETAPLISGANPRGIRYRSAGKPVDGVEIIIDKPDPESGIGEIWARGKNVMQGYYDEPEITRQVMTTDSWFRTGDLGKYDQDGFLYILGRLKNVIIGPSGENIYPEEIESVINRFQYVMESVVVQRTGKLIALVHFNIEELESQFGHLKDEARTHIEAKIEELKKELEAFVNERVNRFSKVQMVMVQPTPFEKTATKKIKRYLYF